MTSIDKRLQALEGRTDDAGRVRVRIFDAAGRELDGGKPTGRTLEDFAPDPEAITVQMDFSADRQREKWYTELEPGEL